MTDPVSIWSISIAVGVAVGAVVALVLLVRGERSEPGTPAPEIPLDNTPVQDEPAGSALILCPHDVPLNRPCDACEGVLRGRRITLDGEPESADTAVIDAPYTAPPPVHGTIGRRFGEPGDE